MINLTEPVKQALRSWFSILLGKPTIMKTTSYCVNATDTTQFYKQNQIVVFFASIES